MLCHRRTLLQIQLNATRLCGGSWTRLACKASTARPGTVRAFVAQQPLEPSTTTAAAPEADLWKLFDANVSGEWEGITATFNPSGEPQALPEYYVPAAYREWEVELWDWQSQCSSTTDGSQLRSVVRRLMPTVGCEADAIAFTEEASRSSSSSSSSNATTSSDGDGAAAEDNVLLVAAADGSYSTGPAIWPSDDSTSRVQVEHCFMLPSSNGTQGGKVRVKVVQTFRRGSGAGAAWMLASIDLHRERHDGPYTGRRELAGCGGGQQGIAKLPPLQKRQLAGTWVNTEQLQQLQLQATNSEDTSSSSNGAGESGHSSTGSEPSCLNAAGSAPEGVLLTLLPIGAWSAVGVDETAHVHTVEAGVVIPLEGTATSSSNSSSSTKAAASRLVSSRRYVSDHGVLQHGALVLQEHRR